MLAIERTELLSGMKEMAVVSITFEAVVLTSALVAVCKTEIGEAVVFAYGGRLEAASTAVVDPPNVTV